MTAPGLHQFVPTFEPGAVGSHMLELQRLAREDLGVRSEIFAEHRRGLPGAQRHTGYGSEVAAHAGDVLVYQMAIGSVVADFVTGQRAALVVNHHNITPARFSRGWDPGVTGGVEWGHAQLRQLAASACLGVAVSAFNQEELAGAGFAETAIVPVLVDLARSGAEVDEDLERRLAGAKSGTDWLFVGRLAPHKCQHDVIKAFAAHRRLCSGTGRLWLVGGASSDRYGAALEALVSELGLEGAVVLTGPVPQPSLVAYYRSADVFVCLSEHEGFCVPVLEAWWHRVPVVAFAAGALPETVAGAGLLLRTKGSATVAGAVARLEGDPALRAAVVEAGAGRLELFSLARTRARFAEVLEPLLP